MGPIALFYHGVENKIVDARIQTVHRSFNHFEKHIEYLRKHFEVISLDYLYECLAKGYKMEPSQALITFDDGYKNNLKVVAPFLKAYDLPFSVFISTRHIHEGIRFPTYYVRASIFYTEQKYISIPTIKEEFDISTDEKKVSAAYTLSEKYLKIAPQTIVNRIVEDVMNLIPDDRWLEINNHFVSDEPMNWHEVVQLHNLGATIGSHCHDHAILHRNQSHEEISHQLKASKDFIERYLGECKYIAYPNGGMDYLTFDALKCVEENEYLLGFTTVSGEISDQCNPYILPRIGPVADLDDFKFTLNTSFRQNSRYYKWHSQISVPKYEHR